MRKRILLSLILLLITLFTVFADTTVRITVNVTRNGNGNNARYTATVTGINPTNEISVWYSTSPYTGYIPLSANTVVASDVPSGTIVYFKASDSSYTSEDGNSSTYLSVGSGNNPTGSKTVSLTTNSKWGIAEEARLYYFPRNVVDNRNVMINLTSATHMSASDFNEVFVNYSESNLALFRIRENLITDTVGTGATTNLTGSIKIRIESLDDWTFVSEYNSTRTTTFTLDAFCVEQDFHYTTNPKKSWYTTSAGVALNANSTLSPSGNAATFKKIGNYYELELPYTFFQRGSGRYYPMYIRNADVCLNIPEFGSGLEPGYYTTELRVTIPAHNEVTINQVPTLVAEQSFTITVRGYLGIDAEASGSSSFYVLSMEDTYSMDLGISSNPAQGYSVAEAKFAYFNILSGPEGVQNATGVLPTNPETKFTVYISPTSDYTDTTSQFRFIKIGSERQARTDDNTIYYSLSWQSDNSRYDNQTTATIYMRPKYSYKQISKTSSGNTGRDSYQVNWEMDNIIKLYLTDQSLQTSAYHQEGMYYSYIYFTLVTNT